jgi:hypothetical protein
VKPVGAIVRGNPTGDARSFGLRRRIVPTPADHALEQDLDAWRRESLNHRYFNVWECPPRRAEVTSAPGASLHPARNTRRCIRLCVGSANPSDHVGETVGMPSPIWRTSLQFSTPKGYGLRCPARLVRPHAQPYPFRSGNARDKDVKNHGDLDREVLHLHNQVERTKIVGAVDAGPGGSSVLREVHPTRRRRLLFMVIERFKGRDPVPIYERLREQGRALPDGLRYIESWVEANFDRCFQLMECDDAVSLQQWVLQWRDLAEFEIVPVSPSKSVRDLFPGPEKREADPI